MYNSHFKLFIRAFQLTPKLSLSPSRMSSFSMSSRDNISTPPSSPPSFLHSPHKSTHRGSHGVASNYYTTLQATQSIIESSRYPTLDDDRLEFLKLVSFLLFSLADLTHYRNIQTWLIKLNYTHRGY